MASSPRHSLERSMNQFRRELTDVQIKEISGANRISINREIQKIQIKLGGEKSLCRLGRMSRFLDTMEEIEKLVSIFLNVSEAVAFIWGPVKLVLMIATTWTNSIKNIIDVYEEIAIALDNLAVFRNLIRHDEQLKRMLEDYFSDILRFHSSILEVFSKPDWKRMFMFIWREFRRNVKPIIESLKRKQAMLSDDKLQQHAILKSVQDSDLYAKDQFGQIQSGLDDVINLEEARRQKQEIEQIMSCLERKLNVSLAQIISQLELPDMVIESSGRWILSNLRFQSWEVNESSEGCVLYLNGCPGAGKSTLVRTIIRYLKDKPSRQTPTHPLLVYFFFKHNDADRKSFRSMLCHIITQIINTDGVMMRFAYDKCSSMDYLDLPFLKSLASDCLFSQRDITIVLDGLDEAKDNEPENVLKWCLYELLRMAPSRGCHIRLLICGQEDGRIEPLLSSYPQIRLHTADLHRKDIEEYCKGQASVIRNRFRLSCDDENDLILKVSEAAKGMFLYAKVVLSNLASMGSRKEYKAQLEDNEFPRDLDEAYERIIQRVIHAAGPSAQTSAKKILGWVGLCDPDDVRADNCKQLCSSLVDATDCEMFPGVESEQTINIIHETASKYLVYTNTIDLMREHIAMSLFCCRYLSSRPFLGIASDQVCDVLQSGYFGFMDYAAAYYQSHVDKTEPLNMDIVSDLDLNIATAKNALSDLEKAYQRTDTDGIADIEVVAGSTEEASKLLAQSIQDKVIDIRMMIHTQWDDLSQNTGFKELEGEKRHKCTRLQCPKFPVGYPNEDLLRQHRASHERPFRCKEESCFAYVVGYTAQTDLQRHNQKFHNEESRAKISFPKENKAGEHELISACRSGDLKHVKLLHRLDADLSGASLPDSPLMVAFKAKHGHICKYLVENGVDPFVIPHRGMKATPIDLAIRTKDFDMLELFLFTCQQVTSPLNEAHLENCIGKIVSSYPPGVEILLQLSIKNQGEEGSLVIDSILVDRIAFLFDDWRYKLAAYPGSLDLYDHWDNFTLGHSTFRDLFPKLYFQGKFFPDRSSKEYKICQRIISENKFFLHIALAGRNYRLATFWMDIDTHKLMQIQDEKNNSPLHVCIMESCNSACDTCILMVERLVKLDTKGLAHKSNNNDLNYKDKRGSSPLHYARTAENMQILVRHKGVDLFSRNKEGQTCFMTLFKRDDTFNEDIMRILLEADIRLAWTAEKYGQCFTPLHYALLAGRWKDRKDPKGNGYGPSRIAKFLLDLPEVEQVLQAYAAEPSPDCRAVRAYAVREKLGHALEIMDKIGFGLSATNEVDG
uniref:NACHT domain-containing protein n=1 Tax=Gibberella zeae TaxID=5518 RepID=A0A4E9EBI7_GIBZA